jgi:hypothetical protein
MICLVSSLPRLTYVNTGSCIMFSVTTNIYNKKTKGPTLLELFTVTGKLKNFFRLEMFDVCTTGDTAHIDTIFKFLPHTRQHGCSSILHYCNDPYLKARIITAVSPVVHTYKSLVVKKKNNFFCGCEQFH